MRPLFLFILLLAASVTVEAGDIDIPQIFGPSQPGKYKQPAAITEPPVYHETGHELNVPQRHE